VEVKKMNKKMILATVIVFLMLLAVAPVMACPTHSQKVTAWNTTTGLGNPPVAPKYSWTTAGGITIEIGYQSDVVGKLGIGSNTYNIYSHAVSNLVYNSKTGVADRLSDAVWYVPTLGSSDGFSGIVNINYIGVTSLSSTGAPLGSTSYSVHLVLQGFGEFKGQTLILSYDGPSVKTAEWTGYCLIPT
jgi:hypothetical protein